MSISFDQNEDLSSNNDNVPKGNFYPLIRKYDNGKRIMVVDDEEFCIAAMKIMLELAGVDAKNKVDFCIHG